MTMVQREAFLRRATMVGVLLCAIQLPAAARDSVIPEPVPPPASVRSAFDLSPFYRQWIDVEGMPVVASAAVDPYAVKEAAWLIRKMIGHRKDVLRALAANRVRFAVMAHNELTTEIPEHSDLIPGFYWIAGHAAWVRRRSDRRPVAARRTCSIIPEIPMQPKTS